MRRYGRLPVIFWGLAVLAIAIWSLVPGYTIGWDSHVYVRAIQSLQQGHDPYADGIAAQQVYHAEAFHAPGEPIPYTYVYTPLTLPLLRLAGTLPLWLVGAFYWSIYALLLVTAIWVCMSLVEEREMRVFALLAPAAVFFPGLLQYDGLFNGNVAYVLYGLVLGAAWMGWKRERWVWFYLAVLFASCFKPPLLSLLVIAVLSSRRQWAKALITFAAGVALFAVQPRLAPSLFRNFLEAVDLQFRYNHDFSSSSAGVLADALYNVIPYRITSGVVYGVQASVVVVVLLMLRRRYLDGQITAKRWLPVVLIGVVLLNPRIMEYDVAPITVVMALVAWRLCGRLGGTLKGTVVGMACLFAIANVCAPFAWKTTECIVLTVLFAGGAWDLFTRSAQTETLQAQLQAA